MLIYLIIFPNNKKYVGQTRRKLNQRLYQHQYYCKHWDFLLYRAIRKYGWNNIKIEVVEDNINDLNVLNEKETFYILKYDTFKPNGYNMDLGGKHRIGYKHSEKTKKKISKVAKEGYKTGKRKNNFANVDFSGSNNPMFGKKHSEQSKERMRKPKTTTKNMKKPKSKEHRKHMSEAMIGKWIGDKNPFYGKKHSKETIEKILKSKLRNLKCSVCNKKYIGNWKSKFCSDKCRNK